MKKTNQKVYIIFLILSFLCFLLAGCSKDDESLTEKAETQLEYLDTCFLNMLNKANGISFKNYIVASEKINTKDSGMSEEDGNLGQTSSNSNSGESKSSGQEGGSESQSSSQSSDTNNVQFKMNSNNILSTQRTPDWDGLKTDIENLYSSWSIIALDLYKENVNNKDILSFNTDLDNAARAIKSEDKAMTLTSLAKLYSYLPSYFTSIKGDSKRGKIYQVKSNILNAYALIEQNQSEQLKKELAKAEENYLLILNEIEENKNNQTQTNKAYILLKDLQNSIDPQNVEIFYIKYKNLIEELNILD